MADVVACPAHCTTCTWDSATATTACTICENGWYTATDGTCKGRLRHLPHRKRTQSKYRSFNNGCKNVRANMTKLNKKPSCR